MRAGPFSSEGRIGSRWLDVEETRADAAVVADGSGVVTEWNATAEQLFGWTRSEMIGRPLPIVPREDWPDLESRINGRSGARGSGPRSSQRPMTVASSLAQAGDSTSLPSGNARMEAVGRLAGGVAHDFNNILTAIAGYAGLLANGLAPDDPKQRDVAEIRKATERATRLTRQLLTFGR